MLRRASFFFKDHTIRNYATDSPVHFVLQKMLEIETEKYRKTKTKLTNANIHVYTKLIRDYGEDPVKLTKSTKITNRMLQILEEIRKECARVEEPTIQAQATIKLR